MLKPTDKQWWSMCDAHMSRPVSLRDADLSRPFVYDREYGLFYVPMGYHQQAMALLLAFKHGLTEGYAVVEQLGLRDVSEAADEWLMSHAGTCFKSSQGALVQCGRPNHLSVGELRQFEDVQYLAAALTADDNADTPSDSMSP